MTDSEQHLELMGVPGSPYTRKMLALLRYRRVPYRFLTGGRHAASQDPRRFPPRPKPRVPLLPTFYLKDANGVEQAVCDTTPLIRRFEEQFEGRSVIPNNPGLAFIDYLIEDYADEWLTKAMFHYRWSYEADIKKAGQILPRWNNNTDSDAAIAVKAKAISDLQISRLSYVGSNDVTGQTIEDSFHRFLGLLDKHLESLPFILGNRPSACDFAVYGQLTCLALFDPTPAQIIIDHTPRVYAWTESMEDLSGYESFDDDWIELETLPQSLIAILEEIGRLYAPYLLANDSAVRSKAGSVELVLDGRSWLQAPFPYQSKCLRWIREAYAGLSQGNAQSVRSQLSATGVLDLIE